VGHVTLIALSGILLLGLAVALVGRAVALPRIRASERLGGLEAYGFAPAPSDAGPIDPAGDGIAQRIGNAVAAHVTNVREDDLRRELMAAGMYKASPRALLGYRVLAAALAPTLVLWLGLGSASPALILLVAALSLPAGWMLPLSAVRYLAKKRAKQVDRQVPDFIDLLVVTVEAGMGLGGAIRMASDRLRGPLGEEVRLAVQEQQMGLSSQDALTNMVQRTDTPALRSFVRSLVQGESLGVSIGDILRAVAVEMRNRRRQAAEEQAQKAPIKMLFPLAFFIFPSMFVVVLGPAALDLVESMRGLS
jgi:tight adherence protein C